MDDDLRKKLRQNKALTNSDIEQIIREADELLVIKRNMKVMKPVCVEIYKKEVEWRCPSCNMQKAQELPGDSYCSDCGVKLDWSSTCKKTIKIKENEKIHEMKGKYW